ncbi:MAG: sulfite exporter TauE/SafE family protein [Rhodospirillaceae bacterium]|nr:MAG: sulfite exporter TauE/SafE family protein [Rhodospirillaceae bacterium]
MEGVAVSSYLLLAVTAFVAGAMNAVAGGGSFLTFPVLVFTGVPSIIANASNTVALFPSNFSAAWAYRHHLRDFDGVSIKRMLAISVVGGILGAVLLLSTTQHLFDALVPWLLLGSSLAFTFGPWLAPRLRKVFRIGPPTLLIIQFVLAIYGGYFGAAVGILLLAAWSLLGRNDIHGMNAAKTILVGSMNCVATVCFVVAGKVWWPQALTMMAAAMAGGYLGARLARRVDPRWIRAFIITACFVITAIFFVRH